VYVSAEGGPHRLHWSRAHPEARVKYYLVLASVEVANSPLTAEQFGQKVSMDCAAELWAWYKYSTNTEYDVGNGERERERDR
jgi:hypothetical protein